MLETTDEFLLDCERLMKAYHDPNPNSMSQIVVAPPCQPINSYQETFEESLAFARKHGLRLHTHLGEGGENPPIMMNAMAREHLLGRRDWVCWGGGCLVRSWLGTPGR